MCTIWRTLSETIEGMHSAVCGHSTLTKTSSFLKKHGRHFSAPLRLACERLLVQDDFELVCSPEQRLQEEKTLPGPYWKPVLNLVPREISFLGRVLRNFAYTWRHVIRREMNMTTFRKLAYAIIWISRCEFTLLERMGFEYGSEGGPLSK
jgi:hypothetical protein